MTKKSNQFTFCNKYCVTNKGNQSQIKMKECIRKTISPFLQYPYVHEMGDGCNAIIKSHDLYVKCNKTCDGDYCRICKLNLNIVDVKHRIVGGFKDVTPTNFVKMTCYKKVIKQNGENMKSLKKQAKELNLTLNMDFVEEMCKKKTKRRKKTKQDIDISIVSDTDEDEPRVIRGRGRPKHINEKNNDDLFKAELHGMDECQENDDENSEENDDDEKEIVVEYFEYTGNQEKFKNVSLYIDTNNIIYNNLGEILGNYYPSLNEILDLFEN